MERGITQLRNKKWENKLKNFKLRNKKIKMKENKTWDKYLNSGTNLLS